MSTNDWVTAWNGRMKNRNKNERPRFGVSVSGQLTGGNFKCRKVVQGILDISRLKLRFWVRHLEKERKVLRICSGNESI